MTKKLTTLHVFIFIFLLPYIVGWTPVDSSYSEYVVGVVTGQYATYDCSGNVQKNPFVDGGIKATHKFEAPFRIGVSGSFTRLHDQTTFVPYPDLALDFKYLSLGTTGLRIGSEDDLYGEISLLDQVPASSGKGLLRAGIGG